VFILEALYHSNIDEVEGGTSHPQHTGRALTLMTARLAIPAERLLRHTKQRTAAEQALCGHSQQRLAVQCSRHALAQVSATAIPQLCALGQGRTEYAHCESMRKTLKMAVSIVRVAR
jgi:hypothetical protein